MDILSRAAQSPRSFSRSVEHRIPKTKIVCTIGPNTNNKDTMIKMMEAGMSVTRMNFSHGDHKFHGSIIANARAACAETGRTCAILLDTKGPEIRSGKLKEGKGIPLSTGQKFTFTTDTSVVGDASTMRVSTTYQALPQTVKKGNRILVNDGLIEFLVESVDGTEVYCSVMNDAVLGETKGMNLPGCKVDLPAVTEKDKADIAFGVEQEVDFIAASFIRKPEDVLEIRALPGVREKKIKIISKIESQEGLDNFQGILAVSDGIMVARGDLGVEIPIERVALAQKMMIRECNLAGKPVITATQMLESMIQFPRPTRAEATDVANAVYDGTDCVMLSGETANGKYPLETISTMAKICLEAEKQIDYRALYTNLRKHVITKSHGHTSVPESIASSAVKTSWDLSASLIIVLSDSGDTLRFVSKYRPHTPIICITAEPKTTRQILVTRGALPRLVASMRGSEHIVDEAIKWAKSQGICKSGESVVITGGHIEAQSGSTNVLRVSVVP
eukprot:TRINITY_DN440_c0_g2_i1.p1 TRINITY_DN440_c0_g2~~TRINITY_DN440_c0_g2_i1.p1  ORF type:complete len:549 (+),score=134.55 TRINITY_DN440_c0_g2_i1:141-1649(+)